MAKMWAGRTAGDTSKLADEFNSSIGFDSRMYKEDITGSIAHAQMLAKQGIIERSRRRRQEAAHSPLEERSGRPRSEDVPDESRR